MTGYHTNAHTGDRTLGCQFATTDSKENAVHISDKHGYGAWSKIQTLRLDGDWA